MSRTVAAIAVITASILALSSCSRQSSAPLHAPPEPQSRRIFVSIPPQAYFVERVGGDFVDVQVLVKPGQSPATYEPSPAQMAALADASVYFPIGVPFENALLPRIRAAAPSLCILDLAQFARHHRMIEGGGKGHEHKTTLDPHTWLDPANAISYVRNISAFLAQGDYDNAAHYERNTEEFITELEALDGRLREQLKPFAGSDILVFHPSFGYFTDAYGLRQVAIEEEGKEPGPRRLQQIIDDARARGTKVIFVQPEFSSSSAEAIAREIGATVVTVDPLARDYMTNMQHIADSIAAALQ